jgi:hypothetical protein
MLAPTRDAHVLNFRHHVGMSVSLVDKLTAEPVATSVARLPAAEGGAPAQPGIYAWWLTDEAALPFVPPAAHPTQPMIRLLYIGIAPKNDTSAETIRSRVLGKHLGNALGSSTLRRGLAALLWEDENWHPHATPADKPALPSEECAALTRWMKCHLRVSWCRVERPWEGEAHIIGEMQPPLNSHHNSGHPFYPALRAARERIMAVARAATVEKPIGRVGRREV